MKAVIFTEGGKEFGFGHVSRCSALFEAFQEQGVDVDLLINGDPSIQSILGHIPYQLTDWCSASEISGYLTGADIAVVDSYRADPDFYRQIVQSVKVPLFIDDNVRINYPGGIVVNGSMGAETLAYPQVDGVSYLLGIDYFILRKPFWTGRPRTHPKPVQTVLITFGGSDIRNLTPKTVHLLKQYFPELSFQIIVGTGFDNRKELENISGDRVHLIDQPDAEGMKTAMLASDMAVSAGGQTLYELAVMGVPVVMVNVIDNQRTNIDGWADTGFMLNACDWDDPAFEMKLIETVRQMINDIQSFKTPMDDGKGVFRLVNHLMECV